MILKRMLIGLSLAAAAAVFASACGGGGETGPGGAGGTSSSNSSSTASSSSSSSSSSANSSSSSSSVTSTGSMMSSSSGGAGACQNAADGMKLMDQMKVTTQSKMCGMMCAGMPMQSTCAKNCMVTALMISDACGICFGDLIDCSINMCALQCIPNPPPPACTTCIKTNCEPKFTMCSGLAIP